MTICNIFLSVLSALAWYKVLYTIIGFFSKAQPLPKSTEPPKKRKYGIVICARNERLVIGNLIESIHKQTYDPSLITIFVCADNCTDDTAEICRNMGCVVYERHDPSKARKGYALEFLFDNIRRDYGIESFDAYIFFDADNLLKTDFVEVMNRAYNDESGVLIGYRNTKNFGSNMISAAYGIHFYRSIVNYHRPRRVFGLNTHIAGTGYLVKSGLLKDGWHCTCLTEDTEMTYKLTSQGVRMDYCEQAEFFDEQPTSLKVSCRQRMRWAKGRLVAFFQNFHKLFAGIFTRKRLTEKASCYDMIFYGLPYSLFSFFLRKVPSYINEIIAMTAWTSYWGAIDPLLLLKTFGIALASTYFSAVVIGALACIRERKHIHCSKGKVALAVLTWFWFDWLNLPLTLISLCMRIGWKPIKHDAAIKIESLDENALTQDTEASLNESDTEKIEAAPDDCGVEYSGTTPYTNDTALTEEAPEYEENGSPPET